MSPTVDVSKLPGAAFWQANGMWPNIPINEFNAETNIANAQNARDLAAFNVACNSYMQEGIAARNNNTAIPAKPIAKASILVVKQAAADGSGLWIAQTDGPVLGVCPDLPPLVVSAPSTGMFSQAAVTASTALTVDQKLDSMAVTLNYIKARLDAAMGPVATP